MAVREFTDEHGVAWRAWDIRREAIHPQTRGEDYLADCYVVGWIVFETVAQDQKRRLCPWPAKWAKASVGQLREMLARAERVRERRLDAERQAVAPRTEADLSDSDNTPDITDLHVVRTFRYPGGRLWTVCVIDHPEDGGAPALRFTAGLRSIDLRPWPRAWADAPNPQLVDLLRQASPRPPSSTTPSPDTPRRRWSDKPPEQSV